MPTGIDANEDAIESLSATISRRIHKVGATSIVDIAFLEDGRSRNVVLARAVWDGTIAGLDLPPGVEPSDGDIARATAPVMGAFPPHISVIGGPGEGRGVTYVLPAPEMMLGSRAGTSGEARMTEPKEAILAERHPDGEWRLHASLQDWVHARPFGLASGDMRLREVERLSLSRALFHTLQGRALAVGSMSRHLSAAAAAEAAGDPALCAATLDTRWRARIDEVIERDALATAHLVLAASPDDERGLVAAAQAALSAERVAARRARRGHTIPVAAVALAYDDVLDGNVRRRFEDAWSAGGLAGAAPKLEERIKQDRAARRILGILPALLSTPGWGVAQPQPDRTAGPIFLRLAQRDLSVTSSVLDRMSRAGIATEPLHSILAVDPTFHALLGSLEGRSV